MAQRGAGLAGLANVGGEVADARQIRFLQAAVEQEQLETFGHGQPADRGADKTGAADEQDFHSGEWIQP